MATKTPELLAEIQSVIANDATLTSRYQGDQPGEMCVLGGLGHHAGITLPSMEILSYRDPDNYKAISSIDLASFANKLSERYALTLDELQELQRTNDSIEETFTRRRALKVLLEEIWDRK